MTDSDVSSIDSICLKDLDFTTLDFSRPKKRSIVIFGHKTSFTLEENFWILLKKMAIANNLSLAKLIQKIDEDRLKSDTDKKNLGGLSSAIRAVILANTYMAN